MPLPGGLRVVVDEPLPVHHGELRLAAAHKEGHVGAYVYSKKKGGEWLGKIRGTQPAKVICKMEAQLEYIRIGYTFFCTFGRRLVSSVGAY